MKMVYSVMLLLLFFFCILPFLFCFDFDFLSFYTFLLSFLLSSGDGIVVISALGETPPAIDDDRTMTAQPDMIYASFSATQA